MNEPGQQAVSAAGAGVGAVIVGLIGIEPQVLFFACVGAGLGIPFASPMGRFRSASVFVLVVLASALLGSWAAAEYFIDATPTRFAFASKGFSLILGLTFHPLTSVVVAGIPVVWGAMLRRFGLGGQP
jgi:hypothetical protein